MSKERAIVYTDRLYNCADGKTAHGLVRFSKRFDVACIVNSTLSEGDAGNILDCIKRNIPLYNDLDKAYSKSDAFPFG